MNSIDIGSVFSRTIELYQKHFVRLIILAAIINVPIAVLKLFTTQLPALLMLLAAPMTGALTFVAGAILAGLMVNAVRDANAGAAERTPAQLFDAIKPVFGALVITAILVGLGVLGGLILCLLPGILLLTWWSLSTVVVVVEGESGPSAMKRSKALVDSGFLAGNFWQVLCVIAIMVGIGILIGIVVSIPFAILGGPIGSILAGLVAGTLSAPLSAIATVLMYEDLTAGGDAGHAVTPPPATPQVPPTDGGPSDLPPAP